MVWKATRKKPALVNSALRNLKNLEVEDAFVLMDYAYPINGKKALFSLKLIKRVIPVLSEHVEALYAWLNLKSFNKG